MFSDNLKNARINANVSKAEMARSLNIPYTTYDSYERGTQPKLEMIQKIAKVLNTTMFVLLGESPSNYTSTITHLSGRNGQLPSAIDVLRYTNNPSSITYPIIGEVAAGFGSEAIEEETGDYEQIPVEWLRGRRQDEFFVLRVKGDSMYPNYMDGDRVLVLRTPTVESGTIAVVLYDGQSATLKKVNYVYGEDWMELEPLNREYAPKRIEAADLEQCRVLGEVKRLIRVISE